MAVLDDQGRLFGVVNVIDAAVVLVALAMVVAGGALLLTGGSSEAPNPDTEPTRYATVAFMPPLASDAAGLSTGDVVRPAPDASGYAVTDVHRALATQDDAAVVARVRYNGTFSDNGPLFAGDSTTMLAGDSRIHADVLAVNESAPTLRTTTTTATIAVNASTAVTDQLAAGQRTTVRNHTVATVESVRRPDDDRPALVELSLRARSTPAGPVVGRRLLRAGTTLPLVTDAVALEGRVVAVGDRAVEASEV